MLVLVYTRRVSSRCRLGWVSVQPNDHLTPVTRVCGAVPQTPNMCISCDMICTGYLRTYCSRTRYQSAINLVDGDAAGKKKQTQADIARGKRHPYLFAKKAKYKCNQPTSAAGSNPEPSLSLCAVFTSNRPSCPASSVHPVSVLIPYP